MRVVCRNDIKGMCFFCGKGNDGILYAGLDGSCFHIAIGSNQCIIQPYFRGNIDFRKIDGYRLSAFCRRNAQLIAGYTVRGACSITHGEIRVLAKVGIDTSGILIGCCIAVDVWIKQPVIHQRIQCIILQPQLIA